VRLSLSHGPCSPSSSSSSSSSAGRKKPSVAELLRLDQLRVDSIQMTLLSGDADAYTNEKKKAKKRAAKSTTTLMQHGPVLAVNVGSASGISTVRARSRFIFGVHA